jgi:hypothetical protein
MSWVQVNLLVRSLSRGWGGLCRPALSGTPFAQVTTGWAFVGGEGTAWLYSHPLRIRPQKLKVALVLPVLVVVLC